MANIEQIREPIREEMKRFHSHFASSMKSQIPLLNLITQYILRRKGKQMRPMFVFLTARLYGEITPSAYTAASLIELLHTATLVHDDVVDHSYERRGIFSINALWKTKIAVLLGDYLLAKGLLLSMNSGEYELLEIVSEAVKEMSEGELLQIQKSRKLNISEEEYFEIIRKKTATLIAACTACGAKAAGRSQEEISRMKSFGEKVGIAFQIKDDIFDYQRNSLTGKPAGNDIQEKKLTLPLIYALRHVNSRIRRKILGIVKNHRDNRKKVQEVISFVRENGGIEYAEAQMNAYRKLALELLEPIPPSPARDSLIQLVEYTISREK
ncbi:MAG TPA: polyprenyl synthetase family protein [Bacteroidetes bacterium]|nr:polyprenyl synthetase family protein [Bacteroidota bacterium]